MDQRDDHGRAELDEIERVLADVDAALRDPAVRENFAKQGLVAGGGTPTSFAAFIDAEARKWGAIIRETGITLD